MSKTIMVGSSKSYIYEEDLPDEKWILKIVTINVPQIYIDFLDELKKRGIYPSRSEAVRVAIREFVFNELEKVIQVEELLKNDIDGHELVYVPSFDSEGTRSIKTYKVRQME